MWCIVPRTANFAVGVIQSVAGVPVNLFENRVDEIIVEEELDQIYRPLVSSGDIHLPLSCSGEQCSMQGVNFGRCISLLHPPNEINLDSLLDIYPFERTRGFNVRKKRNLLYWFYATNYYNAYGPGDRMKLPKCLLAKIRECYPNLKDEPYVGYIGNPSTSTTAENVFYG